jgi:hypothetical protein
VFASWPGNAGLMRTLDYKESSLQQKKEQNEEPTTLPDPDVHPLATLHLENFNANGMTLAQNWFLGDVEQKQLVYSQNPPQELKLRRSERLRNLAYSTENS